MAEVKRIIETEDGAALSVDIKGAGPDLLLVCGLGGQGSFWDQAAKILSRDFRVISFDHRGHGASSPGREPFSIAQLARDCSLILEQTGATSATICGHSMGGCAAQLLLREKSPLVRAAALSATWATQNPYIRGLFGTRLSIARTSPSDYAAISAFLSYPPNWLSANWRTYEAAAGSRINIELLEQRIAALCAFDSQPVRQDPSTPVLVLGAQDDLIAPFFLQEELVRLHAGAKLVSLPTGGHFFPRTEPQAYCDALRHWIRDL